MPELFLKMDEHIREGKIEEARCIQNVVNEIIELLCSAHGNMYAVIKAVIKINSGIEIGSVRKPLAALADHDMRIVEEAALKIRKAIEEYA